METCSQTYRERFLKSILSEFKDVITLLKSKGVEKDPPQESDGLGWFTFVKNSFEKEELKNDKAESFILGVVEFNK